MPKKKLDTVNATKLKAALWDVLEAVREGKVAPNVANSVATQAREILRTVKVELQISGAGKTVRAGTKRFAD